MKDGRERGRSERRSCLDTTAVTGEFPARSTIVNNARPRLATHPSRSGDGGAVLTLPERGTTTAGLQIVERVETLVLTGGTPGDGAGAEALGAELLIEIEGSLVEGLLVGDTGKGLPLLLSRGSLASTVLVNATDGTALAIRFFLAGRAADGLLAVVAFLAAHPRRVPGRVGPGVTGSALVVASPRVGVVSLLVGALEVASGTRVGVGSISAAALSADFGLVAFATHAGFPVESSETSVIGSGTGQDEERLTTPSLKSIC